MSHPGQSHNVVIYMGASGQVVLTSNTIHSLEDVSSISPIARFLLPDLILHIFALSCCVRYFSRHKKTVYLNSTSCLFSCLLVLFVSHSSINPFLPISWKTLCYNIKLYFCSWKTSQCEETQSWVHLVQFALLVFVSSKSYVLFID